MKKRILIIFFIAVGVLFYGIVTAKDKTRVSIGEVIFNKYCAQCHGIKGAGTDKGHLWFTTYITRITMRIAPFT